MLKREFHTTMALELSGEAEIAERDPRQDHMGMSATAPLLHTTSIKDEITWELTYSTDLGFSDHQGCWASTSFYHIEDAKTGRVFHAHISAHLQRADIVKLRDFCTYLLSFEEPSS